MTKLAVIKIGGKQYLVKKNDELYVDRVDAKQNSVFSIVKLAEFDAEKNKINLGNPILKLKSKAKVLDHLKDEKIRIMTYKAKSRYRKTKGFRASLTKIKIIEI
jgi:large subunit ribosomal protein L21